MKNILRVSFLFILSLLVFQSLRSQELKPFKAIKKIGVPISQPINTKSISAAVETVYALATMVEFKEDNEPKTSGTGKFIRQQTSAFMIDPPPYGASYFRLKLKFLENYYRKFSKGKLVVKTFLLDSTISLSKEMSSYSPKKLSSDNKPLAEMVVDSWKKVDSIYTKFQFSNYQCFIIFHSGIGRDIDLMDIFGYDPTPFDIPSLYLNLPALQKNLDIPNFPGIQMNDGSYITNTIILPSTETRIFTSGSRTDTLQLSTNGLLAASFASYLGLPDLFNTKTGASAIGQFGLMDGAAIFSFRGLFPPQPSAWERIKLGWTTPITLTNNQTLIHFPAVGDSTSLKDSVYQLPITSKEYFLIENRNRFLYGNKVNVTVVRNNSTQTLAFTDTTGFTTDDVSLINGSVIDVDNFDWSLPGDVRSGSQYAGGGILIWHIDESIIEREWNTNSINADPKRRGVALIEADGSNDIGQSYELLQPGYGSQYGSPLDCWYAENPQPIVYKNVFDKTSTPNSNSNSGIPSDVTIREFSKRSKRMSAIIETGSTYVKRLNQFTRDYKRVESPVHIAASINYLFYQIGDSLFGFTKNFNSISTTYDGLLLNSGVSGGFSVTYSTDTVLVAAIKNEEITILIVPDSTGNRIQKTVVSNIGRISSKPIIRIVNGNRQIVVGREDGKILLFSVDGNLIDSTLYIRESPISNLIAVPSYPIISDDDLFFITGSYLCTNKNGLSNQSVYLNSDNKNWFLVGGVDKKGSIVIAASENGQVNTYDVDLKKIFELSIPGCEIYALATGDVDGDGLIDIIIGAKSAIYVLNRSGAVIDGYPVKLTMGKTFGGSLLFSDVNSDGKLELLCTSTTGDLYAFNGKGNIINNFPIPFLPSSEGVLVMYLSPQRFGGIAGLTKTGCLDVIEIQKQFNPVSIGWTHRFGNESNTGVGCVATIGTPPISEYFPKSRVYNWPNPVYGSVTYIRFYVSEPSSVKIIILDLAGEKVTELRSNALGGMDNEIKWDVTDIQSGVYLARVEVNSGSKSGYSIIKIAVVK